MMMQIKFLGELLILNILSRQRTGKMTKLEKHTQPQPAQSLHHSYEQNPFTIHQKVSDDDIHNASE